jgi:hypothetical protein
LTDYRLARLIPRNRLYDPAVKIGKALTDLRCPSRLCVGVELRIEAFDQGRCQVGAIVLWQLKRRHEKFVCCRVHNHILPPLGAPGNILAYPSRTLNSSFHRFSLVVLTHHSSNTPSSVSFARKRTGT